ncbi:unnamed protein product [Leptidea sinapis]|uniref:Cathepsin propeptide inhibitor domain-containing protein n=1 Tax=Leptidea sinapis TaxID=189913 RepID=A0A5E4QGT2_9NEOP|nr:unnamed protein product [Leptidea sinapis]
MQRIVKFFIVFLLFVSVINADFTDEVDDYEEKDKFVEDLSSEDGDDDEEPIIYNLKDAPKLFEKFVKDYNKDYKTKADYQQHYKNFVSNLRYINDINSKGRSASSDINQFTDLSDEEIEKSLL